MTHRTASMAAPTASALALLGIPLLLGAEAGAADLNARDFFGAPGGHHARRALPAGDPRP